MKRISTNSTASLPKSSSKFLFSFARACLCLALIALASGLSQTQLIQTSPPARIKLLTLDLGCAGERNVLTVEQRVERAKNILDEFPADIVFIARGECAAVALAAATHRTWIPMPAAAAGAGLLTTWTQSPAKDGELWKGLGARLKAGDGREVIAFAIQFPFAPYQPYQLCGVAHDEQPFMNSAEAAIAAANTTRGLHSEHLAVAVRAANTAVGSQSQRLPVIAAGMVNEPSGGDWCDQAVRVELCPMRVMWPAVLNLERAGLRDAYRASHSNVVDALGSTWPTIPMKRDRSDRIDFIFTNALLKCAAIEILGEAGVANARNPKPTKNGLPGEHRALHGEFELTTTK